MVVAGLGAGYESPNLWRFDIAPMLETTFSSDRQLRNMLARIRVFLHRGIFDARTIFVLDFDHSGYHFQPQATFSLMRSEDMNLGIGGRYSYVSWNPVPEDPKTFETSTFYQHTEFIARFRYTAFELTAGIGGGTKELGITGFANVSMALPQKEFVHWHE